MQHPSTSYYSTRYPAMLPPPPPPPRAPQSAPVTTHSSSPQPHPYSHPQYPTTPHHQYVYPPTYSQSPYFAPPAHSQYPIQQLHVIPPYITRPQMQPQPIQQLPVQQYVVSPKETPERDTFYAKLHAFREEIGEPIQRLPTLGFKELDLWVLYKEVTKRRGIDSVIAKKQWKEVAEALQLPSSCTDSGFRLRLHYKKYLEAFERKFYRPPPTSDHKKEPKKLQRACSVVSTDSTVTQVAGENSGSSGSGSRASGPGSSSDSMMKRVAKKKRRAPSSAHGDRSGSYTKRRAMLVGGYAKNEEVTKSKKQDTKDGVTDEGRLDVDKAEATHNLRVLEAAVMAVDGKGKSGKTKKRKVDFSVLDNCTLKRYAKAYDVSAPSVEGKEMDKNGKWKRELAESVSTHFSETPLVGGEHETLLRFIQAVRRA